MLNTIGRIGWNNMGCRRLLGKIRAWKILIGCDENLVEHGPGLGRFPAKVVCFIKDLRWRGRALPPSPPTHKSLTHFGLSARSLTQNCKRLSREQELNGLLLLYLLLLVTQGYFQAPLRTLRFALGIEPLSELFPLFQRESEWRKPGPKGTPSSFLCCHGL